MKKQLLTCVFSVLALCVAAQLPQFSSKSFDGWIYSNPITELNQSNIVNNRIFLYRTSTGLDLTLTSPAFTCRVGQIIDMDVTWITDQWKDEHFVVNKVALTAALLNAGGEVVDSVTFTPTSVSKTNYIKLSLIIPVSLDAARLRFASWKADVNSNGAVRQILITSFLRGDVNQDGEVTVADVDAITDVILGNSSDPDLRHRADVNGDGEVGLADINDVIDIIIGQKS